MSKLSNPFISFVCILLSVTFGYFYLEAPLFIFMVVCMFLIAMLATLIRPIYGFAVLVTAILATAFYNVAVSWVMRWGVEQQGMHIAWQTLLSFAWVIAWFIGYSAQKARIDRITLQNEVAKLRKVESSTGLLTINEFLVQAQLLFINLKRRNEQGYLLHVRLNDVLAPYQMKLMNEKISKVLLQSVREKYDLICQLDPQALLLFLNNTSADGLEVVIQRMVGKLEQENVSAHLYSIEIKQLNEEWNETEFLIRSLQTGFSRKNITVGEVEWV